MTSSEDFEPLNLSLEEVQSISRMVAKAIVESGEIVVDVSTAVVPEDQITRLVNLDVIASSAHGITDVLGQIADWFRSVISSVSSWIVNSINSFVSFVRDSIISNLGNLWLNIQSALGRAVSDVASRIASAASSITAALQTAISSVASAIAGLPATISSMISSAISGVMSAISGVASAISGAASSIMSSISYVGSSITSAISGMIGAITSAISNVASLMSSIASSMLSALSSIGSSIMSAISNIPSLITGVGSSIMSAISGVLSAVTSAISGVVSAVTSAISGVGKTILDALSGLGRQIIDFVSSGVKWISDYLSSIGKTIIDGVSSGVKWIVDSLSSIGKTIIDGVAATYRFLADVGKRIIDGLAGVGKWLNDVVNFLVSSFQDISMKVGAGFARISEAFTGFVNAILRVPEMIVAGFSKIGEWIWSALPEWFRSGVTAIGDFFKGVWEGLKDLISDPVGWFYKNVVEPVLGFLEWLWGGLQAVWSWIMNALSSFAKWLWEGVLELGKAIVSLIWGSITSIIDFFKELGEAISKALIKPIKDFFTGLIRPVRDYMKEMIERIATGKSEGEIAELMGMFMLVASTQFTFRMIAQALYWLGDLTDGIKVLPNVAIKILGAGGEATVEIPLKFGAVIKHLAAEFREYPDTLMRGFFYGLAIWYTQPFVRLLNSLWRNMIPIELPQVPTIIEYARRTLPHPESKKIIESAKKLMALYGYSDEALKWYFQPANEMYITVTDRFLTERKIPLSLIYYLPSPSDVATMMVRDIFHTVEDFQRLYLASGMDKDVGALYYFLRFRYPPPERLWQFTVRGVSGLLWATLPEDEKREIEEEAKPIGAFMPVAPVELNFKAKELMAAFKTYMKWHDMARFSWIKGFPSDNMIYVDTLADIPTKIDQRWMIKWGIYEQLSAKGVTYSSPVSDFVYKYVEGAPTSKIVMDIANFCRTLQATGLHPHWVPVTAVAEVMNALTEERTMLRTGFVNLFKEGFWDLKAIERLLAGFIVASFKVAYFDVNTMSWSERWVNHPVMYLPPERKLIELRALMDRALDILREVQKDLAVGYQEHIVLTYDEFKEKLSGVIERVNKFFAEDYKQITGSELPAEMRLSFVEAYYKPYVESLEIWREVHTVRRIRMWTQRWLGWLMYRVATGAVTRSDVARFVDVVARYSRLTEAEKAFLRDVMDLMYRIAVRDYAVSPQQLATISEYVVVPAELIEACFEAKLIPEEWREIWRQYISIRPMVDDVKALINAYRRALLYVKVPPELEKQVLALANEVGYTERELSIIGLRVQLEELITSSKEFLPSPSTLAALAEYVQLPEEMIRKALEARRVPPEWIDVWVAYIRSKPLKSDVKSLLSAYIRALRRNVVAKEELEAFIKSLPRYGFSDDEVDLIAKRVQLEELIAESAEYVPTPSMLASLVEYVPEAREFFEDVMAARRVPKKWQEIWAKYIDVRPIVDDLKRYLSRAEALYSRFMIKKADFERILSEVADYLGYTKKEEELLMKVTEFERYRNAWIELIGTVDRLVALSEYSPRASKFALAKVNEMIDALPIPPADKQELKAMWEEYIRNRPVKSEARTYVTQLINAYVEGLVTQADLYKEFENMKKWGFSDVEIEFYKAQAEVRRARKLKVPLVYGE